MKHTIIGQNLQLVNIELDSENIIADPGTFVYKSGNVTMNTEIKGGLGEGLRRMIAGEDLFLTEFCADGKGIIGFGGDLPGKIKVLDLRGGREFVAQRGAFICGSPETKIEFEIVKKAGAAVFGGQGVMLQKLKNGLVFLHAAGDLIEYDLTHGEILDVDTGHVVGFEPTVSFDIEFVGGIKSTLFGGEGMFFARMTGPGKVIVQSMTREMLKPKTKVLRSKLPRVKHQGLNLSTGSIKGANI